MQALQWDQITAQKLYPPELNVASQPMSETTAARTHLRFARAVLACVIPLCQGCFFLSSRTLAIGNRLDLQTHSQELLATATALILKTTVETYCIDGCGRESLCHTQDVWWTIGFDDLTRGPEPNLDAGVSRSGRFPDRIRREAHQLPLVQKSSDELKRPSDDACLYKIYEPGSFYPGYTMAFECNGPRKIVRVPGLSIPTRRYHTWWSYPILVVLAPPALLIDVVTTPIQMTIAFNTRSGFTLGCPPGDW